MELDNYDLAKLRNYRDLPKEVFNRENFNGKVYIWSDFHLNDPEIIYVSGRNFWGLNDFGVYIPDTESEKDFIIKELKDLEDNSVFINLGDIGKIESLSDERDIKEVNDIIKKKNIYNILVLGNHDYLKDNRYYEILSGQEEFFYQSLGFDKIIRNPFILKSKDEPLYIFSHKPIESNALLEVGKNMNVNNYDIHNIHGHWHSYGSVGDIRKSACLDMEDKPLRIEVDKNNFIFKETCITDNKFFLKDPWL